MYGKNPGGQKFWQRGGGEISWNSMLPPPNSETWRRQEIECSLSESSLYLGTDLRYISSPAFFKNEAMHMGFIMRKLANNYGACMDLFQCADPLQPVK